MKAPDLTRAARNYAQTTTVQRLGYLLDKEIGNAKLAGALKRAIRDRKYFPIPLLKDSTNDTGELDPDRSEEHTSELQSLMRISYAVFCLKKQKKYHQKHIRNH